MGDITGLDLRWIVDAFEHLEEIVLVTEAALDAPGPRITYVNAAFERITGWSRAEVVGRSPRVLQGPGTDRATLDALRAAMAAGQPTTVELLNYTRNGGEYWVRCHVQPVTDAAGTLRGFISLQTDLTQERRQQAEKSRVEEWFAGACESSLSAVYVLQPEVGGDGRIEDFRFVYANRLGGHLLRREGGRLEGLTLSEALPPSRVAIVVEQCREVFQGGQPLSEEFQVPEYPESMRWLRHQVVATTNGVVITSENITPRKTAELALAKREEWFRAAAEGNLNALFINEAVYDDDGRVVDFTFAHVNDQGGRLVGMHPADMVGRSICELFPVNRTAGYFEHYRDLFLEKRTVVDEFPIDSPSIRAKWLRQLAVPWSGGVALSAEDITREVAHKRELDSRQRTLAAFIEQIPGPAWIADEAGQVRFHNARFVPSADGRGLPRAGGGPSQTVEAGSRADGSLGIHEVYRFPIDADGERLAGGFSIDVTARKLAEDRAEYLTSHDDATGYLNREGFLRLLATPAEPAGRARLVARMSLREAETLRELLGSPVVDDLVRGFADRLHDALAGWQPAVGRDGPDQLLLMLAGGSDAETALLEHWPMLAREVALDGQRYSLNPRLGYAVGTDSAGPSPLELLRASDIAHGQAVARRTIAAMAYEPAMAARLQRRVEIQRELGNAVARDELSLVMQPVFDGSQPARVLGLEALVRWDSPLLGPVAPGEFIPIAEESSAIVAVGDWVLEHACRELSRLADPGHADLYVAVNVAEAQLARGDFTQQIADLLARHDLPAHRLELEITERTLMADTAVHQRNLQGLRTLGVRLSVDDFGTGYSSLSYLLRFAVDKIKIDRSFIAGLGEQPTHTALVRTILTLADSLGLGCVCEGVETVDQLERLLAMGCGQFQGYLLARPMPPAALARWMAERAPAAR